MTNPWIDLAISVLHPLLEALIALAVAYAVSLIRQHVHHVQLQAALVRLAEATGAAVHSTQVRTVERLKAASEDGTLTLEEIERVRLEALADAREYLGPKGVRLAREVLGHDEVALDNYLRAKIEEQVRKLKATS